MDSARKVWAKIRRAALAVLVLVSCDTTPRTDAPQVEDSFTWLDAVESPRTRHWITEQDSITRDHLAALSGHAEILARVRELYDATSPPIPVRHGDFLFTATRDGGRTILHATLPDGNTPRVVIDPHEISPAHDLANWAIHPRGSHVVYVLQSSASAEGRVHHVEESRDLDERFDSIDLSVPVEWLADGSGFLYADTGSGFEDSVGRLMLHRMATPASADVEVHRLADRSTRYVGVYVAPTGANVVIEVIGTERALFVGPLDRTGETSSAWSAIEFPEGAATRFVHATDAHVLLWTDHEAPRGRVVRAPLAEPLVAAWREVVGEAERSILSVTRHHQSLFVTYVDAYQRQVRVFRLDGAQVGELGPFPAGSTIFGLPARSESPVVYFVVTTMSDPGTVYAYDLEARELIVHQPPANVTWDPDEYVTEYAAAPTADGAEIPLRISYRRESRRRPAPLLLSAYGAFGQVTAPGYSAFTFGWLEDDGIYVHAGVRGGGEYGRSWRDSGRGVEKGRGVDDFIAAAEWLVAEGYTTTGQLVVRGSSAGTVVVAGATNRRPDLFAASVLDMPLLDLMRSPSTGGGAILADEFGDPSDPEQAHRISGFSPYDNLPKDGSHPPTLVTAGELDAQVGPAHAYKYAAKALSVGSPVSAMLRVNWRSGHFPSAPDVHVAWTADRLAFLRSTVDSLAGTEPR